MMARAPRRDRVLTLEEYRAVCEAHKKHFTKRTQPMQARTRWMVFRLACNCGLRCCEIIGLKMKDVNTESERPHVVVRRSNTKNCRNAAYSRAVPLSWSPAACRDIADFKLRRLRQGAGPEDYFLVRQDGWAKKYGRYLGQLHHGVLKKAYYHILRRGLGVERAKQLSPHTGRHTFITHSLYAQIPAIEVMAAAGHNSLDITTLYCHLVGDLSPLRPPVFFL